MMARTEPELSAKIQMLLTDPKKAKALAAAGAAFAERLAAQCESAMASLETLLPVR
jgi:hypothetical protein